MKLLFARMKERIGAFREATDGVFTIEMIITLPFLFWMITTSYELYEMHRFKSARIKASYTVSDMLSREMLPVNDAYIDTVKTLFDGYTRDQGDNQIRVSVVSYEAVPDRYVVRWSETRGDGPMAPLTDAEVGTAHNELPVLQGGQELIIVESAAEYEPVLEYPGLRYGATISTQVFTGIRFAPQLCWEGTHCG